MFKIGEKIIYIGTHDDDLFQRYGHITIQTAGRTNIIPFQSLYTITYNKTYVVKKPNYNYKLLDGEVCIENDVGIEIIIDNKFFKSQSELRKEKLEKIENV